MDIFLALLALVPVVPAAAVAIRYLVQGLKLLGLPEAYAGFAQALLNAGFYIGLLVAAHYGVESKVQDSLLILTSLLPGIIGLIGVFLPIGAGILVTKFTHDRLNTSERTVTIVDNEPKG